MRYITFFLIISIIVLSGVSCSTPGPTVANPEKLHTSAGAGDYAAVKTALNEGNNVDLVDGHGRTPLFYAVSSLNISIIEYLLIKGANPNHRADNGDTPLLVATKKASILIVDLLVQKGAQINSMGEDGFSPLTIATSKGDKTLFDLIMKLGAKPDNSLSNCDTALIKSIKQEDAYFFDQLIEAGADPNLKGYNGNTPLIIAVFNRKLEMAKKLLTTGARVNDTNDAGYSALTFAANAENLSRNMTMLLIEKGADVNKTAKDGLNPLKVACLAGNTDMAAYLYEKGANPDFNDSSDEGVELNGTIHHILGDYFLAKDDCDKARASYNEALGYYQKSADKYSKDATTLAWKKVGAYALMALAGSLQDLGASYQANMQSRQMAQISGMKYAEQSHTGINGYYAYMTKYNQTYVPTYQQVNMPIFTEPSVNAGIAEKSAYLKAKTKLYENRIALIDKVLECIDKNPAGRELHECVNSISVTEGSSSSSSNK